MQVLPCTKKDLRLGGSGPLMPQFLLEKMLVIIYLQTCFKVNSNNKYKKKKQTDKKALKW